jgi:hypothetical protein
MTVVYKQHPDLKQVKENKQIENVVNKLLEMDSLDGLHGNCVLACEIVQNMLSHYGVDSKTVECQLMIVNNDDGKVHFNFVGLDGFIGGPGTVDTHVVVITNTNPPVLIDASISKSLPVESPIVVRVPNSLDPESMGVFKVDTVELNYNNKKNIKLPYIHQRTLVDRMKSESSSKKQIDKVRKLVMLAIIFGTINLSLNLLLILMKIF